MRAIMLAALLIARSTGAATFLSEIQQLAYGSTVGRAISSDGRFMYSGVNIFSRDPFGFIAPLAPYDPGTPSEHDVVIGSADAAFLYVSGTHGIGVHARDALTGLLTFVELEPEPPVFPFRNPELMAVTRDGTNLYATTSTSVVTWARNPTTGELTFVEEIEGGTGPGDLDGLQSTSGLVVSPDDKHVYVTGRSVVAFERTPPDGSLTLVATYPDVFADYESIAISPDGADVYAGRSIPGVAHFTRNALDGTLTAAGTEPITVRDGLERFTDNTERLAMAADGSRLIAQVQNYVVVYDRDGLTGALDLVTVERAGGRRDVAISPDGQNVYAGAKPMSVFVFSSFACPAAPLAGCRQPAASAKSVIAIKDSDPLTDKITWRTTPAGITSLVDFGDPVTGNDDVIFCLYDASGNPQPLTEIVGPARGTCGGEPCWEQSSPTALKYKDDLGLPGGLQKVTVRQRSADSGVVKIKAKGRGLALSALPLVPPVRAQLISRTGMCWDSTFSVPRRNLVTRFSAKSD